MHELILHKEFEEMCLSQKSLFTLCEMHNRKLVLSTNIENGEGVGTELHAAGEETALLVIVKGRSWEGRVGDIPWVAAAMGWGGAMLYFVENECDSVSLRCQASCWELCASLKGDSRETEPHCCCHGHSASQLSAVGNRLVQLAAGCRTWVVNHVIFTMYVKATVKLLATGFTYRAGHWEGWHSFDKGRLY